MDDPSIQVLTKRCNKCGQDLPFTNFNFRQKRGRRVPRSRCISCEKADHKAAYEQKRNDEEVKAANRERSREAYWKRKGKPRPTTRPIPAGRKETYRRFYTRHTERAKQKSHRRRANNVSFTDQQWIDKCRFWGWCCYLCGKQLTAHTATVDHRKPLSRGGSGLIANVAPACAYCNKSKFYRTEREYRTWLACGKPRSRVWKRMPEFAALC